jgi:hypothetical protein
MKICKYNVLDTTYHLHCELDGSSMVEVRYAVAIANGERLRCFSEYLNFESKCGVAKGWWVDRSPDPLPATNQQAIDVANYHGVDMAQWIEVAYDGVGYRMINIGLIGTAISRAEMEYGSERQAGMCSME